MNKTQKALQAEIDERTKDFVCRTWAEAEAAHLYGSNATTEDDVFREMVNLRKADQCCVTCRYENLGWNGTDSCGFLRPRATRGHFDDRRGYFRIKPYDVCDYWEEKAGQSVMFEGMHA